MSLARKIMVYSISIVSFSSIFDIGNAQAEMATGFIGSQMDPQTHQFPTVYKDWREGVILNPQTGDYTVTYKQDDMFYEVVFVPATKINPVLKSKFKMTKDGSVTSYNYSLKNETKSVQPIHALRTEITNINANSLMSPEGWRGNVVPNLQRTGLPVRLNWSYLANQVAGGLPPGKKQNGFRLDSNDLPGITIMRIEGAAPTTLWLGSVPDVDTPVGAQILQLTSNNYVPRPVAVPLIPVSNPFDAAAVLTSLQKHVNQDMVSMNLIDPAFASQLDRLFQTAIAAAKGGNTVALKGNLKDLRQMLKREHADVDKEDDAKGKEKDKSQLIDKLAAKVLDFDLKYILKRLGHND